MFDDKEAYRLAALDRALIEQGLERRRQGRVTPSPIAPVRLKLNSTWVEVRDISAGGISFSADDQFIKGREYQGQLLLPESKSEMQVLIKVLALEYSDLARARFCNPDKAFDASIQEYVSTRQAELLDHIVSGQVEVPSPSAEELCGLVGCDETERREHWRVNPNPERPIILFSRGLRFHLQDIGQGGFAFDCSEALDLKESDDRLNLSSEDINPLALFPSDPLGATPLQQGELFFSQWDKTLRIAFRVVMSGGDHIVHCGFHGLSRSQIELITRYVAERKEELFQGLISQENNGSSFLP